MEKAVGLGQKFRVCLASWAPFIGGAEVAVERLALGLLDAGHEVFVVVGTDAEALCRFRQAGIRCEYIPQRFTNKLGWWRYRKARNTLAKLLHVEQPDIVHSNDLPTHQMVSDAARRVCIPVVCHHRWVFDGSAIDWFNKYGAERHLFVSQALMGQLSQSSSRLATSSKSVVYDGLPLSKAPNGDDRVTARRELGLPLDKQMVLFAGQIIERKGIADLLHGWAQLVNRWRDHAELCVIGDDLEGEGVYRRKMEKLAAELGCPVRFMGFQRNVDRWLTAADIVMVPSHVEPLGNATLEAMAVARPVIGGAVGGIPEMIVDEHTGLLIPPKSPSALAGALSRLLSAPSLATKLGESARIRCEEFFSLETHTESVLAEYRQVLDIRSRHPGENQRPS